VSASASSIARSYITPLTDHESEEIEMADNDAATAAVGTEPVPPVVSGSPEEIADGVFVVPDRRVPLVPNIGVVVGDRAALVVDAGMGPNNGKAVYAIARELAGDRPLFLTITHFHPEHGFGASELRGATIVYNREQHEEFRDKAQAYVDMFRGFGPQVAEQLEGVELVEPHVVYDGAADIDLGGKLVRLRSWGLAHTRGDQVVFLPAERVLFTGDLVENRFFSIFPYFPPEDADVNGTKWIAVLEELQKLDPTRSSPSCASATPTGTQPSGSRSGCAPLLPNDACNHGLTLDQTDDPIRRSRHQPDKEEP
jgi:glyoxylase-like metal-dependent hydrolase (beta-lactamase superfamily II)